MNIKNTQLFNSKGVTPLEMPQSKHSLRLPKGDTSLTGFTLIELLAVMVIILIIAGMFVGVSGPASQSAKKRKAEVMISALEVAISMYHADTGGYPPNSDGSVSPNTPIAVLRNRLTDINHGVVGNPAYIPGWAGPYMEFKSGDIIGGEIVDPWKRGYWYTSEGPPPRNAHSFDLWSIGPDGVSGNSDDRTNW